MAEPAQDGLESMKHRHDQLQHNVTRLQKALSHWTALEAEYQMFKTELESAGDPSISQIREIAQSLQCTLVDAKEVEALLGKDLQTKRDARAVIHLLSKRIDYVQQNSSSIEKQLDIAEKQLAGLDVLLDPGLENEEGLPMMDIEEELDEQGNEVSSSVTRAGEGTAEMIEVLRKVGMQKTITKKEGLEKDDVAVSNADSGLRESFPDPMPKVENKSADYNSKFEATDLSHDDRVDAPYPVIPQDESPEDAELRRQMLQYSLSEVGQVVAELDLDYPTASYSDAEEDDDDYDYEYDSTEDEDAEDEYGRSTKPVVTEEYRKEMMELEKRLGARTSDNVKSKPESPMLADHVDDIRTMRVRKDDQFASSPIDSSAEVLSTSSEAGPPKKGVRFADDIAVSQSTRVSSFKSDRGGLKQSPSTLSAAAVATPQIPSGPPGATLASTITERSTSVSRPLAPDEFDPSTVQHELNAEYHKARNQFIQRQGGFKATDEEDEQRPIVEEQGGQPKKVSRFKAARLRADGI